MAKLNISQAARAVGIARSTIQTHIKQGKLSFNVLGNGQRVIDTTELLRVYGELTTTGVVEQEGEIRHQTTPNNSEILQDKVTMLEAQMESLQRDKEEDRREKDRLVSIIENQTRMLTYQPTEAPAPKEQGGEPPAHPAMEEMKGQIALMKKQNSYLVHMQRRSWWEKLIGRKYVAPVDG